MPPRTKATPTPTDEKAQPEAEPQRRDGATSVAVTDPRLDGLKALRQPFAGEAVGKLPRGTCKDCKEVARQWRACERHAFVRGCEHCGGSHTSATLHLDYVGHADLTQRLLDVDPFWTWEPFTQEQIHALPPALQQAV